MICVSETSDINQSYAEGMLARAGKSAMIKCRMLRIGFAVIVKVPAK